MLSVKGGEGSMLALLGTLIWWSVMLMLGFAVLWLFIGYPLFHILAYVADVQHRRGLREGRAYLDGLKAAEVQSRHSALPGPTGSRVG